MMLFLSYFAADYIGVIKSNMYSYIGILINGVKEHALRLGLNPKLFHKFPFQRSLGRFSCFDLSAGELPHKRSLFVFRTLTYQKFISIPDYCGNYFYHFLSSANHVN